MKAGDWRAATKRLNKADDVPKGFKTTTQIAADLGLSVSRAQQITRGLLAAKIAEVKKFRIQNGARIEPVPHYRLIESDERTKPKRRSGQK